jgi:uncharacterized protein (DUF1330 family)
LVDGSAVNVGLPARAAHFILNEEFVMKAYVIAAETVNDPAMFDLYRREVAATLVPFGGQFVARGGNLTVLEGEWPHPRLVIIAFPSRAAAEDWYTSVSKDNRAQAREQHWEPDHRRRARRPVAGAARRGRPPGSRARTLYPVILPSPQLGIAGLGSASDKREHREFKSHWSTGS